MFGKWDSALLAYIFLLLDVKKIFKIILFLEAWYLYVYYYLVLGYHKIPSP